ncbi:MAG TPA: hypothetical protein PLN52_04655 [Opitutaceae bacterium]|nr:hypothetical protein [Opitutaceae bacterium]
MNPSYWADWKRQNDVPSLNGVSEQAVKLTLGLVLVSCIVLTQRSLADRIVTRELKGVL